MSFSTSRMLAYGALALGLGFAAYQLCQTENEKKEEPEQLTDEGNEHITEKVLEIMDRFRADHVEEIFRRNDPSNASTEEEDDSNKHLSARVLQLLEENESVESTNGEGPASPPSKAALELNFPTAAKSLIKDDDV